MPNGDTVGIGDFRTCLCRLQRRSRSRRLEDYPDDGVPAPEHPETPVFDNRVPTLATKRVPPANPTLTPVAATATPFSTSAPAPTPAPPPVPSPTPEPAGGIPSQVGGLPKLRALLLGANLLNGKLPVELSKLDRLDVALNEFAGCVPDVLKSVRVTLGTMRSCSDAPSSWAHRPVFEDGVDLSVTYIERLPRFLRYKLARFRSRRNCAYPFDEFRGPVVCPEVFGVKGWSNPGEAVELAAHV